MEYEYDSVTHALRVCDTTVWRLWQVMEYEYDSAMEVSYQLSFLKSFKRQIDDCYFSFIIVDAVFDKLAQLEEFWSYAMSKGFQASTDWRSGWYLIAGVNNCPWIPICVFWGSNILMHVNHLLSDWYSSWWSQHECVATARAAVALSHAVSCRCWCCS